METNPAPSSKTSESLASTAVLSAYAQKIFISNWKILSLIGITPIVVAFAAIIIFTSTTDVTSMGKLSLAIFQLVVLMFEILLVVAMIPTMLKSLAKIDNGSASSIRYGSQFKEGFRFFLPLLGLTILQTLIVLGAGIILIIPGIILNIYLYQFMFARILDGKKGFAAFIESYSLIKGRWWKVVGRIVFLALAVIGWRFVINIIGFAVGYSLGDGSIATSIIRIILEIVMAACMYPVIFAYMYKLYNSLKETRIENVRTSNFKKILVASMVIGVIVVIFVPMLNFLIPPNALRAPVIGNGANNQVSLDSSVNVK